MLTKKKKKKKKTLSLLMMMHSVVVKKKTLMLPLNLLLLNLCFQSLVITLPERVSRRVAAIVAVQTLNSVLADSV